MSGRLPRRQDASVGDYARSSSHSSECCLVEFFSDQHRQECLCYNLLIAFRERSTAPSPRIANDMPSIQ
jgi:hypothetical protein